MKQENSNVESLISNLKPAVFWKDKPILIEQSKKWNKEKLQTALKKTYNTEIEIKSNSSIRKDLLIKNLIIELCATASSA
jgi:DNA polymerase III delta subunit